MKANELMIGDWVYNTNNRQNERVQEITSGLVMLAYNDLYEYDEIEPIPLTPEILEKNGFKKYGKVEEMYYWNWGIGNNYVSYNKITGVVRIFHIFGYLVFVLPLSYTHQLQHALRLCNIDKTIEL